MDIQNIFFLTFVILQGEFVLARSRKILETDFLRGRIKERMRNDVLGWFYLIFFYDFGQEQWVHIEDIRLMPEKVQKFDGLAYKCTLKGQCLR